MRHPALIWSGVLVFASAAVDWVARAAGLYADFPGLWGGMVALIEAAATRVTIELVVMAAGIALFVWGIYGDRLKRRFGSRAGIGDRGPLATLADDGGAEAAGAAAQHMAHTEALDQLRTQIERLENGIVRSNQKHVNADRDLLVILDSMIYIAGYTMIRDLASEAPLLASFYEQEQITAEWLTEQKEIADRYVGHVARTLSGTSWGYDLRVMLQHTENEADRQIGQMPADRRPEGMDRFDLRPYVIAKTRCEWTAGFLQRQKHEAERMLGHHLTQLHERMAQRRPTLT